MLRILTSKNDLQFLSYQTKISFLRLDFDVLIRLKRTLIFSKNLQASEKPEYVEYSFKPHECGITAYSNGTTITYEGRLHGIDGMKNSIISRQKELEVPFKCNFDADLTVSVEDFFTPITRNDNQKIFKFTM